MVSDVRESGVDQDDQFITDSPTVSSRIFQMVNSVTNRLSNANVSYNSRNWSLPSWTSYSVFRWRRNRTHRSSSMVTRPSPDGRNGRSTGRHGHNGRRLRGLYDPHTCTSSRLNPFMPPHSYAYHRDIDIDSSPLPISPETSVENNNSESTHHVTDILDDEASNQSVDSGQCGPVNITSNHIEGNGTNNNNSPSASSANEANLPSYPGDQNDSIFFPRNLYNRSIFGYSMLDRGLSGRSNNRQRRLFNRLVRGQRNHNSYCRSSGGPLSFPDDREKNFLSALMSILVIATLATAFTQPKWFSVKGGVCGHKFIGLQLFIELNPSAGVSHYLNNNVDRHTISSILTGSPGAKVTTSHQESLPYLHSKSTDPETRAVPKNIARSIPQNGARRDLTVNEGAESEMLPKPQSLFSFNYPMASDSYNQIINNTIHSLNLTSLLSADDAATIDSNERHSSDSSSVDEKLPKKYDEKAFKKERQQLLLLHSLSPLETLNGFNHLGRFDSDPRYRNGESSHPSVSPKRPPHQSSNSHHNTHHVKRTCSYNEILPLQRTIVLLCLIAILANLAQFFLDTLGTNKKWLNIVRVHAIGSIFGVICSIFIIGICYIIATLIEASEKASFTYPSNHPSPAGDATGSSDSFPSETPSHIEVRFELSYYMITLAGLIGLFASACNLLKYSSFYLLSSSSSRSLHLVQDRPFDPSSPSSQFNPCDDEPLTPLWASGATGISFALPSSILSGNISTNSSSNNSNSVNSERIPSTNIIMPSAYPHPFLVQPPPPYTP